MLDKYSAIVVGSGISGLYAAIKIAENENCKNILLVTKAKMDESNSRYAQGGIVGVLKSNPMDSVKLHVEDTLKAGNGLVDKEVVTQISEMSGLVIEDLIKNGINFDKNDDNSFSMTLEGAHSVNRILHAGGDGTGIIMESVLAIQVLKNSKITMVENTLVTKILLNKEHEAIGVEIFQNGEHKKITAGAVILATGGAGQIFSQTTNPKVATADGHAVGLICGAILQDMEFIQFHPTALNIEGAQSRFLISESARGEGAKLINSKGEYFAKNYHELADLAPRDIVTRAICSEIEKTGSSDIFLDMSIIPEETVLKRFPRIKKECEKHGINILKDPIPVSPAAHYCMGGIKIDLNGQTSIKNLYAIGETGCSGLHGANRLASNSLLECVVLAYNLAKHLLSKDLDEPRELFVPLKKPVKSYADIDTKKQQLRKIMWENAGIIRSKESLEYAFNKIMEFEENFDIYSKYDTIEQYEFRNMLLVSKAIVQSAYQRKESRGGHYRSDYPETFVEAIHSYSSIRDVANKELGD